MGFEPTTHHDLVGYATGDFRVGKGEMWVFELERHHAVTNQYRPIRLHHAVTLRHIKQAHMTHNCIAQSH